MPELLLNQVRFIELFFSKSSAKYNDEEIEEIIEKLQIEQEIMQDIEEEEIFMAIEQENCVMTYSLKTKDFSDIFYGISHIC